MLTETHLDAQKKERRLYKDCLFFCRIIPNDRTACAALIGEDYDGAGCTNENYIIKPESDEILATIWFLFNFDTRTQEYFRFNSRGQGRGRILEQDLLNMPIFTISTDQLSTSLELLRLFRHKSKMNNAVMGKIYSELSKLRC